MATLVIVGSDALELAEYRAFCRAAHHDVLSAMCAEEALGFCKRERPDLVIADIWKPGIGGCAFIKQVRALSAAPIMVMSRRAGREATVSALRAGADTYVVKPVGGCELVARVNAALRRWRPGVVPVYS